MVKLVTMVIMVLRGLQLCRCRPKQRHGTAVLPYLLSLREPHEIVLINVFFARAPYLSLLSSSVSGTRQNLPQLAGPIFGFRDAAGENATEARFLAVPDPKLAEEHLRTLTQAPHHGGGRPR